MRHFLFRYATTAASTLLLVACSTVKPSPSLYQWDNFPRVQYEALLHPDGPMNEQVQGMEAQAEKARANGVALPPGFRAHLGMLKLSLGDVDQARQWWKAEEASFPESVPYMDQLLKRLDAPAPASAPKSS